MTYSATEPPPRNGSLYSLNLRRSGKTVASFVQARDLPPGYLRGVYSAFI